jgi:DNA mismatch endonuclease (patch repair protein)
MENTPQRDTPAEMALRRELFRRGLRYRVDLPIRGVTRARPDIAFPKQKLAVFVDGCFWHSCPEHGTMPKRNRKWWAAKLAANVERDRRHERELAEAGWTTVRVWEHEDPSGAADRVEDTLRELEQ